MTNCASRFISGQNALDLIFLRPDAVGLVPVDLRMTYRTIGKFRVSRGFQLLPSGLAVGLLQPLALTNGGAGRNRFHVRDWADNFEGHALETPG